MRRKHFVAVLSLLILSGVTLCLAQTRAGKLPQMNQQTFAPLKDDVRLMTLDPGHFHAALVQKTMYQYVSPVVQVYAPPGSDLTEHLKRIEGYNTRAANPTGWTERLYTEQDFLARMLTEKPGNVVVIVSNNRRKIDYINASLQAGLVVLADKPICIDVAGYEKLKAAFKTAAEKRVLLYDIMTERFEITTMLQRALVNDPAVFGRLQKGTPDDPAVTKESVHHLFKYVSGKPLQRPGWFFDVTQQGEGLVDITTHLVDLIQWESFPDQSLTPRDVKLLRARRWPTIVTREQFQTVTGLPDFPDYLRGHLNDEGALLDYANGEMLYTLKGVHARVSVIWNFEAPQGAGDTHFSVMRGTKASVLIRQGKEENYRPELYVEAAHVANRQALHLALRKAMTKLEAAYPGLELIAEGDSSSSRWHIRIPDRHRTDHEAHFGQVMENFLRFLRAGKMPAWETPNMITKYYTTTKALEMAETVAPPVNADK